MNKTAKQRLLTLAEHLEKGKLGHEEFDFNMWNKRGKPYTCGFSGCAIGECPIVFPKDWRFSYYGDPILIGQDDDFEPIDSGIQFFDLTLEEFEHLFLPRGQMPDLFGGSELGDGANKEEVAANIRAFVERKEGKS